LVRGWGELEVERVALIPMALLVIMNKDVEYNVTEGGGIMLEGIERMAKRWTPTITDGH
jgi:hypothetical protein